MYTEQTWQDGNPAYPLSAARMQHIEDGLAAVANGGSVSPLAAALGFVNWNVPFMLGGSTALTSQTLYATGIWLPAGATCTGVVLPVVVAGAGAAPAGFYVGLANTQDVLAQSANLAASSLLTATAMMKQFPFTAPVELTAAGLYYVLLLQNGVFATTQPQFLRSAALGNAQLAGQPAFAWVVTGQTVLPANGQPLPAPQMTSGVVELVAGVY